MNSRYESWDRSKLSRLMTPDFQRRINNETVRNIYLHIAARMSQEQDLFLGSIDVAEVRGRFGMFYYIIDGQHRVKALKDFMDDNNCNIDTHVIVYPCSGLDEANVLFEVRNRNVMQTDYVLSGDMKRELLDEIQGLLADIPEIFVNVKTRRPKICLPMFMDKLRDSDWFKPIYTMDEFLEKFRSENERLSLLLNDEKYISRNKISPGMIRTWNNVGVFIGVDQDFTWLH